MLNNSGVIFQGERYTAYPTGRILVPDSLERIPYPVDRAFVARYVAMRSNHSLALGRKTLSLFEDDLILHGEFEELDLETFQCETDMSMSEWSSDFIHGADILFPTFQVAERLLKEGETISVIDKLYWHKKMKTNLSIRASLNQNTIKRNDNTAMIAVLRTSEGREIYIQGDLNGIPYNKNKLLFNDFARLVLERFPQVKILSGVEFEISTEEFLPDVIETYRKLDEAGGLRASIFVDAINIFRQTLQEDRLLSERVGSARVASYKNLIIPTFNDIFYNPKGKIRLKIGQSRRGFIPAKVSFYNGEGDVVGGGEYTIVLA